MHTDHPTESLGGVILCGGRSRRMGRPKADLPFGPETMLQRVAGRLSSVARPIVVVAAQHQELPALDAHMIVARDRLEMAGPLAGMAVGLGTLPPEVTAAYVTSCDVPFLSAEFVRMLVSYLGDHEVVVPVDHEHHHPLAAIYRRRLVPVIERLLAEGCRRPRELFQQVPTCRLPTSQLQVVDPNLDTLMNLNHPHQYRAALRRARLPVPPWLDDA